VQNERQIIMMNAINRTQSLGGTPQPNQPIGTNEPQTGRLPIPNIKIGGMTLGDIQRHMGRSLTLDETRELQTNPNGLKAQSIVNKAKEEYRLAHTIQFNHTDEIYRFQQSANNYDGHLKRLEQQRQDATDKYNALQAAKGNRVVTKAELEQAKLEMEQAKAAYEVALNKHNQAKETDSLANNLDYKAKKELEKATNTVIQPIPPQAEKPKQGLLGLGFWVL